MNNHFNLTEESHTNTGPKSTLLPSPSSPPMPPPPPPLPIKGAHTQKAKKINAEQVNDNPEQAKIEAEIEEAIKMFEPQLDEMSMKFASLVALHRAGDLDAKNALDLLKKEYDEAVTDYRKTFISPFEDESKENSIPKIIAASEKHAQILEEKTKALQDAFNKNQGAYNLFQQQLEEIQDKGSTFDTPRNNMRKKLQWLLLQKEELKKELDELKIEGAAKAESLKNQQAQLEKEKKKQEAIYKGTVLKRRDEFTKQYRGVFKKQNNKEALVERPVIDLEKWIQKKVIRGYYYENLVDFIKLDEDDEFSQDTVVFSYNRLANQNFDENLILGIAAGYITRDYEKGNFCVNRTVGDKCLQNVIYEDGAKDAIEFLRGKLYGQFPDFEKAAQNAAGKAFVGSDVNSPNTVLGAIHQIVNEANGSPSIGKLHANTTTATTTNTAQQSAPQRNQRQNQIAKIAQIDKIREEKENKAKEAQAETGFKLKRIPKSTILLTEEQLAQRNQALNQEIEVSLASAQELIGTLKQEVEVAQKRAEEAERKAEEAQKRAEDAEQRAKQSQQSPQACLAEFNGSNGEQCILNAFASYRDNRTEMLVVPHRLFASWCNLAGKKADLSVLHTHAEKCAKENKAECNIHYKRG